MGNCLTETEKMAIIYDLADYGALFIEFLRMSYIEFDDSIPTACVYLQDDIPAMSINPSFWSSLQTSEKSFVIAHECMHVVLDHINRIGSVPREIFNYAADLVTNRILLESFLFTKDDLPNLYDKMCLVDSLPDDIRKDGWLEYYFDVFNKYDICQGNKSGYGGGIDNHDRFWSFQSDRSKDTLKEILSGILSNLSDQDFDQIIDVIGKENNSADVNGKFAGTIAGDLIRDFVKAKKSKVINWDRALISFIRRIKFVSEKHVYQFRVTNRRFAVIQNYSDLIIPSELEDDNIEKHKLRMHIYLDNSGSCYNLAGRFIEIALSVPKDVIDLSAFCFDTRVHKIDLEKPKGYGFGGTSFSCIEKYIQCYIKDENIPYPDVVVVLTDGYGDVIHPQYADRWFFFIDDNGSTSYVPKESKYQRVKI